MELFQTGATPLVPTLVETDTAQNLDDEETRTASGHGAGGKSRKSRRGLKRSTPYDRPAPARHATTGGLPGSSGSVASSSSFASRIVGSASRLIEASFSYLLPSLFGGRTLSIPQSAPGRGKESTVIEEDEEEQKRILIDRDTQVPGKTATAQEQGRLLGSFGFEQTGNREFDLARVEEMLKRTAWLRDQVSRLRDLLSTRLTDDHPSISRQAEATAAANAGELIICRDEENMATPNSEAKRWREELKCARTDCVPVEVAKAYMGDRKWIQSSFTQSFQGTAHQLDRVARLQPSPRPSLAEDRYRSLTGLRLRTISPTSQLFQTRSYLDEEWMSLGPVRRRRHKLFGMNSSPYARALPFVEHSACQTYTAPPVPSRQTAQKILDTLGLLSPFPIVKNKSDESTEVGSSGKFSGQSGEIMHQTEKLKSNVRDAGGSNGRLELGSPMQVSMSTMQARKDSQSEDKCLGNRLLSSSDARFFSTSTSLLSSSAAERPLPHSSLAFLSGMSGPITSTQSQLKASFACSSPLFETECQMRTGAISAHMSLPSFIFSPCTVVTSTTGSGNSDVSFPLCSPVREEHFGTDCLLPRLERDSKRDGSGQKERLIHFQFRSPSIRFPFSVNAGIADSPSPGKGSPSILSQDGASEAQPNSQPLVETTTNGLIRGESLCVSSPGLSPLSKVSGQPCGPSRITKPSPMAPLILGASSAPFTFSPPPPFVSCSTPTFSSGSNAGPVSVSLEAASSKPEAVNKSPVFDFTSPAAGPELPVPAIEETALPVPSFSFGTGPVMSAPSLDPGSDSRFCFGSGTSPSFRGSALTSTSTGPVSQTPDVSKSMPRPCLNFGGQAMSGQLSGMAQSSLQHFRLDQVQEAKQEGNLSRQKERSD